MGNEWYYLKEGRQFGPVPENSIRAWLESGFLGLEDFVWREGMAEWLRVGDVPELSGGSGSRGGPGSPDAASGTPGQSASPPQPGGWRTQAAPPGARAHAGFWLRAAAYVIDSFLLSLVLMAFWWNKLTSNPTLADLQQDSGVVLTAFFISLIYYSILESSPMQATLGKRLFRLRVTDLAGNRISPVRAVLRQLGKLVSGLIFYAGYVMAGFTAKRQALHDMLSGCLVVRD